MKVISTPASRTICSMQGFMDGSENLSIAEYVPELRCSALTFACGELLYETPFSVSVKSSPFSVKKIKLDFCEKDASAKKSIKKEKRIIFFMGQKFEISLSNTKNMLNPVELILKATFAKTNFYIKKKNLSFSLFNRVNIQTKKQITIRFII